MQVGTAALFLLIIVLCVLGQFLSRSLLGTGLHWASETARFAFVWCALLGAAAAWQDGALHRVDILARTLRGRLRVALEILVLILIALTLLYLLRHGIAITHRVMNQTSSTLQISMAWVYAAAPAMAALMLASTLLTLPDHLRSAYRGTPDDPQP